ncbi:MAG: transcriptional repressor [Desulfonauticus sp.]|nr:transcriptional repressor [Desulfonauticus sp.]
MNVMSSSGINNYSRLTKQRKVILEVLKAVDTHPTADEVYEMVRKKLPRISLGTVYRNLQIMSEIGLIQKLELAGKQKRFDGNPDPHYHIRCIECDRVFDLPELDLHLGLKEIAGFKVVGAHLEILGICPNCQKKEGDH